MKVNEITWSDGLGLNSLALWAVDPCQAIVDEVCDAVMDEATFAESDGPVQRGDVLVAKLYVALFLLDQIREKLSDFDGEWRRERKKLKSYREAVEEDQQDA